MVLEATGEAIQFNRSVINDEGADLYLRQISAKNILNLGHAKAIEKKGEVGPHAEIPAETLENLIDDLKELEGGGDH